MLLENGFGTLIGGKHPTLIEEINKVLQHATVYHAMVRVNDFYELEQSTGLNATRDVDHVNVDSVIQVENI